MTLGGLGLQTRETHRKTWQAVPAEAPGAYSETGGWQDQVGFGNKDSRTGVFCQASIFVNIKSGILPLQIRYFVPRLRISFLYHSEDFRRTCRKTPGSRGRIQKTLVTTRLINLSGT